MTTIRTSFVAAALIACQGAAMAQQTPSPQGVNACTQITDPNALRRCLERNAGVDDRFVPADAERRAPRPLLKDRGAFKESDHVETQPLLRDSGVGDRAAGPPP